MHAFALNIKTNNDYFNSVEFEMNYTFVLQNENKEIDSHTPYTHMHNHYE